MRALSKTLIALILAGAASSHAEEPGSAAARTFERLSSLVGDWDGRFEDGRPHSVSYRLTANGSVLLETWSLAPGRESLTLYHRDGDDLLATHYCPQGNQPRLRLVKAGEDEFSFEFRDGTNLQVPGRSHQHAIWLKLSGSDSYLRSESYVENGSTPDAKAAATADGAIVYTRRSPTIP